MKKIFTLFLFIISGITLNAQIGKTYTSLEEALNNPGQVYNLDLSHKQLGSLPESIGKLTNLTWLDLNHNQLTSLPESIGKLIKVVIKTHQGKHYFSQHSPSHCFLSNVQRTTVMELRTSTR